MAEKKHVYHSDVLALPPLRLVLGDVPSPDPERRNSRRQTSRNGRELEVTVKKLIAHLTEND